MRSPGFHTALLRARADRTLHIGKDTHTPARHSRALPIGYRELRRALSTPAWREAPESPAGFVPPGPDPRPLRARLQSNGECSYAAPGFQQIRNKAVPEACAE